MKELCEDVPAPRVGDPIEYRGSLQGHVLSVEGNLCWVRYRDGGSGPFIWRFKDGLNKLHAWPGKPEGRNAP